MVNEKEREAAKALAAVIRESEQYKNLVAAQNEYNGSETVAQYLREIDVQQQLLISEYQKNGDDFDTVLADAVQKRIGEINDKIVNDPAYVKYKEASDEYAEYHNEIDGEIDFWLTGKRASCSGDCSSCGGCN